MIKHAQFVLEISDSLPGKSRPTQTHTSKLTNQFKHTDTHVLPLLQSYTIQSAKPIKSDLLFLYLEDADGSIEDVPNVSARMLP